MTAWPASWKALTPLRLPRKPPTEMNSYNGRCTDMELRTGWTLYVDESGQFDLDSQGPRSVGGILCPDEGFELLARYVSTGWQTIAPWWPWPVHATEFRQPGAHMVQWLVAGCPEAGPGELGGPGWHSLLVAIQGTQAGAQALKLARKALASHHSLKLEDSREVWKRALQSAPSSAAAVQQEVDNAVTRFRRAIAAGIDASGARLILCGEHLDSEPSAYWTDAPPYEVMLLEVIRRSIVLLEQLSNHPVSLTLVVLRGHLGRDYTLATKQPGRFAYRASALGGLSQLLQAAFEVKTTQFARLSEHVQLRTAITSEFDGAASAGLIAADWVNNALYRRFDCTSLVELDRHVSIVAGSGSTSPHGMTGLSAAGWPAAALRAIPDIETLWPTPSLQQPSSAISSGWVQDMLVQCSGAIVARRQTHGVH